MTSTLLLILSLFLCVSPGEADKNRLSVLRIGTAEKILSANILLDSNLAMIAHLSNPPLMRLGEQGRPVGQLLDSIQTAPDGMSWVLKLKSDLYWSDGIEVTSDDLLFTFDYMREIREKRKESEKKAELRKKAAKSKKLKEYLQLEEEEEEILDVMKVQQLTSYVEERYRQDSKDRDTLTASASTPSKRKLLLSAAKSMSFRIVVLLILIFFIMNVSNFFLLFSPPDIIFSIEIQTGEMIIILLLPVSLAFPVIGSILKLQRRPKVYRRPKQITSTRKIERAKKRAVEKEEPSPVGTT